MNPSIMKRILQLLKSTRGRRLDELALIPPSARYSDVAPQEYFPREEILRLVEWDLVEAYDGGKLVPRSAIESYDINRLKFYISPHAVLLEDTFGINLGASSLFGPPVAGRWPQVLMLMPFIEALTPVFEDHVKKVASSLSLTAGRADDFFSKHSIITDIWSAIYYAQFIVADCTKRNPNVFYELGVAHTLGKNTILISQSLKDVPFDIRHLRFIAYELTPRGMEAFEKRLHSALGGVSDIENGGVFGIEPDEFAEE
jgi:hypothetical protein